MRVISMTPEQINMLPPAERAGVIQLVSPTISLPASLSDPAPSAANIPWFTFVETLLIPQITLNAIRVVGWRPHLTIQCL